MCILCVAQSMHWTTVTFRKHVFICMHACEPKQYEHAIDKKDYATFGFCRWRFMLHEHTSTSCSYHLFIVIQRIQSSMESEVGQLCGKNATCFRFSFNTLAVCKQEHIVYKCNEFVLHIQQWNYAEKSRKSKKHVTSSEALKVKTDGEFQIFSFLLKFIALELVSNHRFSQVEIM